jgi:hypothetical protein
MRKFTNQLFIVLVVRCDSPKRINNGYFQCNPVTEHLNGGTCRFGCYDGFELVGGPDYIHCKDNGQWSDSHPICKRNTNYVYLTYLEYIEMVLLNKIILCEPPFKQFIIEITLIQYLYSYVNIYSIYIYL